MLYRELEFSQDSSSGKGPWLLIFTDLVSLLIVFFVMLYSMGSVKEKDWVNIVYSVSQTFKAGSMIQQLDLSTNQELPSRLAQQARNIDYLHNILLAKISRNPHLKGKISLKRYQDQFEIIIPLNVLFEKDYYWPAPYAQGLFFALGDNLQEIQNTVDVYLHYRPGRYHYDKTLFSSEWEFLLRRALMITEELQRFSKGKHIGSYVTGAAYESDSGEVPDEDVTRIIVYDTIRKPYPFNKLFSSGQKEGGQ